MAMILRRPYSTKVHVSWLFAVFTALFVEIATGDPVQVFILAGQSNMQGHGWYDDTTNNGVDENGTLRKLVESDPSTYGHLLDGSNNWVTRFDVDIFTTDGNKSGGLTVGFGVNSSRMGPELGFGTVIGDAYSEDVFIVKTNWGGKSLAVDFISPTAAAKRGREVGIWYQQMLAEVEGQLANLGVQGQDYVLKGFGWHQGWNDRVSGSFTSEYEENLVDFINDVRFDLRASDLPFVIANTGIGGSPLSGNALTLANAQLGPANLTLSANQDSVQSELNYPGFVGNVMGVNTIPFWRDASVSPITNGNQGFHWNQNGQTHYLMGEAMGQAMASMSSYVQFERAYIEVDLQSGEIQIINPISNSTDMDLEAIQITSTIGALDSPNWLSITGNYDGSGDSSIDGGNWTIDTVSTNELRETAVPGGGDGLITIGSQYSLGVGAWIQNLEQDLAANYTDTDGNVIDLNIRYVGFDNALGDLTTDGIIDAADWLQFRSGVLFDMSGLSAAQAYQLGDLDGDFDNDIDDFGLFRMAFEQQNPNPGAFEAMLAAAVPEPNSVELLLLAVVLLLIGHRVRLTTHTLQQQSFRITVFVSTLVLAGEVSAQEMFNVNIFSYGRNRSDEWQQQSWRDTVLLDPTDSAGAAPYTSTGWQNLQATTSGGIKTLTGTEGSTAKFSIIDQRNSSPFYWTRTRDSSTFNNGNATLVDGHSVGTEDPYDGSNLSIFQVTDIPFAVYDVVVYFGINDAQKSHNGKVGEGNIDFDGIANEFTLPVSEPDGTLTRIVDAATPGNYMLYEQVSGSSFTAQVWGDGFIHLGPAGFQIVEVVDPTELSLQVNRATGEVLLMGDDSEGYDINFYQITSADNSLAPSNWNSLADQDYEGNGPVNNTGNGWEEGGGVGTHALAEGYLLGDSTIPMQAEIPLGTVYNASIDAQDLVFKYRSENGQTFEGEVEYINVLHGDYNNDGVVDLGDYTVWRNNLGAVAGTLPNDSDGGAIDSDQYNTWKSNFGMTIGSPTSLGTTSVPEPAALVLSCIFVSLACSSQRGFQ